MKVEIDEVNNNEQMNYIYSFFKPEEEAKGLFFNINKPESDKVLILSIDK